ncbi:hypothetical protein EON66_08960 [archaeon]|nr:MAG: hypothetical protein EON66_08960 [archaeon]
MMFTGISFDDRYVPLTVTTAAGFVPRGQGAASAGSAAHRMPAADSAGNPLAAAPSSESVGTLGGGSWFRAFSPLRFLPALCTTMRQPYNN